MDIGHVMHYVHTLLVPERGLKESGRQKKLLLQIDTDHGGGTVLQLQAAKLILTKKKCSILNRF